MKTKISTVVLILTALSFVGCNDKNEILVADFVPASPQGVTSITGDNAVYLYWNGPYEADIVRYIVWRSFHPTTGYTELDIVDAVPNPDLDLLIYEYVDVTAQNGVTYYYAVSAVDRAGQVSELSAENVFDTPRPEGLAELYDFVELPGQSGLDFSELYYVHWNDDDADIYIDRAQEVFFINAANTTTDLQDMGYTESFDDVGWAPQDGWSENGWAEIILGHTYVIWTSDLHYAKVRVIAINEDSIEFQWAYQTDQDNPELKPIVTSAVKPTHGPDYLVKNF